MIASVDTETTGLDLHHGARPFFVTCCKDDGEQLWWDWAVDPLTREVAVPESDLDEVRRLLEEAELLVLHNSKFDASALKVVGIDEFPWWKVRDTLLAAHLLGSNQPKNLTDLCAFWLGRNIQPCEDALEEATKACRRQVQQARLRVKRGKETDEPLASWRIASENEPDMPSAGKETWKYDSWLPKVIDPASTVLEEYANTDSSITLLLWQRMEREIHKRGLWALYEERLKLLPVAYAMEQSGVTVSKARVEQLHAKYIARSARCKAVCTNIAAGYGHELELPKGAVNNSLRTFCFDVLKLQPTRNPKSKTAAPTLNKDAISLYLNTLETGGKPYYFVRSLANARKVDTALAFMQAYERFWLPWVPAVSEVDPETGAGWYLLHPNLNITGTDTLRWSCNNPNVQQISKQETKCGKCKGEGCGNCEETGYELDSLRVCFGPAPGREWWSLDYSNLELVLPAYKAGEEEMIALFEKPEQPPYFGSVHLLNCHVLHPEKFEECLRKGESFKDRYKSTLYQQTKNGSFAIQYGAVESSGTADRAFGMKGAQAKLQGRFHKIAKLNKETIAFAEKHGYVETFPDKTVDPKRGYPLLVTRSEYGKILPTVPLSFVVQGTAVQCMNKAMVRTHDYHQELNRKLKGDYRIALNVHDEMVLDYPYKEDKGNLPIAKEVARLMRKSGDDIGIPLRTSLEYHRESWARGEKAA